MRTSVSEMCSLVVISSFLQSLRIFLLAHPTLSAEDGISIVNDQSTLARMRGTLSVKVNKRIKNLVYLKTSRALRKVANPDICVPMQDYSSLGRCIISIYIRTAFCNA